MEDSSQSDVFYNARDVDVEEGRVRRVASNAAAAEDLDEDMLKRVIRDAGRWAFGMIAVEVWVLEGRKLEQPAGGGTWIDPTYINSFPTDEDDGLPPPTREQRRALEALERLVDRDHPRYVQPGRVSPGVGLAGALWTEADNMGHSTPRKKKKSGGRPSIVQQEVTDDELLVCWRDVPALAADPDQPPNERLQLLADAGVGLAAGVPFKLGKQHRGIVVYMTRKTADPSKLRSQVNESYLHSATAAIGAVSALKQPRMEAVRERRRERVAAIQRVKNKLLFLIRSGADIEQVLANGGKIVDAIEPQFEPHEETDLVPSERPEKRPPSKLTSAIRGVIAVVAENVGTVARKSYYGGEVKPPPAFNFRQTIWTFFGVFTNMILMWGINGGLSENTETALSLAPLAALSCMHYALTASPAAQPRTVLYAQALSMSIGMLFSSINGLHESISFALVPAIATACMVKLGIPHPPAASAAVTFTTANCNWSKVGVMLMANFASICVSMVINNLSEKRQYPTFWSFFSFEHIKQAGQTLFRTKGSLHLEQRNS